MEQAGFRVTNDDRPEKVNLKIREAQLQKIPYMLVLGDREEAAGTVSLRHRKHADLGVKSIDEVIAMLRQQIDSKVVTE
jgi:threonyl-tRNA synthetase